MPEHDLQSITFPTLDESQIAALGRCTLAAPKRYRDGQTLFTVGDRDLNFFGSVVTLLFYPSLNGNAEFVTINKQSNYDVVHLQ